MFSKRTSCALVTAVGVVLVIFPLATGLFGKTSGVEDLTGAFRTSFTEKALTQTRSDLDGVTAMSNQLQTETLPALPGALGMTPAQFQVFMGETFPHVATGVSQLNQILLRFDALVGGLEQQAPNFRKADAIPTGFLPSTVVPYLFLLPGLLMVLLGAAGLARSKPGEEAVGASVLKVSAVVGAVLLAAPLVLSVHSKAEAVDGLTGAFGPVFTKAGAAQVRSDMDVVQAMADELQSSTLPALASGLKMSPPEFASFIAKNYPDVAAGVGQLNVVLPRFQALVAGIENNRQSFALAASIPTAGAPTTALFWWLVVPGALLVLVPVTTLTAGRVREPRGALERAQA